MAQGRSKSNTVGDLLETRAPRPDDPPERVYNRAKINKAKECNVLGCRSHRDGLAPYCYQHRKNYRYWGHPTANLKPPRAELVSLEKAIQDWLEHDRLDRPVERLAFRKAWGSAVVQLRPSPSFAVPFSMLEGDMRYTSRTKAKIVLAWYHHKRGKPLGALMLRYMAVRLWVELRFQMPPGKTNATREKNYLANTLAGRHAVNQAEVFKHTTAEKVVGWEKPWFVSTVAEENLPAPITEKVTKRVGLTAQRKASIGRAVGAELRHAVEHALGPRWFTDSELMARAVTALTPPQILTNKEDTKS